MKNFILGIERDIILKILNLQIFWEILLEFTLIKRVRYAMYYIYLTLFQQ